MAWFSRLFGGEKKADADASPREGSDQVEAGAQDQAPDQADEVLEEDNRSLIRQLISANGLSMGMDLNKVTLPTFILEPRSLLEKIGDIACHPELFSKLADADTPEQRMIDVVRWYFSAYHIRPKGAKKPFNPVLGETWSAQYHAGPQPKDAASIPASADVVFHTQQVSHHPPVTAFFIRNQSASVAVQGSYAPKTKFLGNSAASHGGGGFRLAFSQRDGEQYFCNWPNAYVRGILFGKLLMEIGGTVIIRCPKTDLSASIEFVTKGYFSGTYHAVKATIFRGKEKKGATELYLIEGSWTDSLTIKDLTTGDTSVLLSKADTHVGYSVDIPFDEDKAKAEGDLKRMWDSRATWAELREAIKKNDQKSATEKKSAVEDYQRKLRAQRTEEGVEFVPSMFKKNQDGSEWIYVGPDAVEFPPLPTA